MRMIMLPTCLFKIEDDLPIFTSFDHVFIYLRLFGQFGVNASDLGTVIDYQEIS
jgi:hypothetical protein